MKTLKQIVLTLLKFTFWGEQAQTLGLEKLSITVNIPLAKPGSLSFQNNLVVHVGQYRKHKYCYKPQDWVWSFLVLKFYCFPLGKERKKRSVGLFWMFCLEGVWVCSAKGGQRQVWVGRDLSRAPGSDPCAMSRRSGCADLGNCWPSSVWGLVFPGEGCICEYGLILLCSTNCFGLFLFTKSLDMPATGIKPEVWRCSKP